MFSLPSSPSFLLIRRISIRSFVFFSSSISCCSFNALRCSSRTSACEIRLFLFGGNDEWSSLTYAIRPSFIISSLNSVGKSCWSSTISASAGSTPFLLLSGIIELVNIKTNNILSKPTSSYIMMPWYSLTWYFSPVIFQLFPSFDTKFQWRNLDKEIFVLF